MWTRLVVHAHGSVYRKECLIKRLFRRGDVPRVLERIVHPLSQCIMQRISRLSHADATASPMQQIGVALTGILNASVAMMNHIARINLMLIVESKGLMQSIQTAFNL